VYMLGINHARVNKMENRSEQHSQFKNHITQTVRQVGASWSYSSFDKVNKLCSSGKVISLLEPVAVIHSAQIHYRGQ